MVTQIRPKKGDMLEAGWWFDAEDTYGEGRARTRIAAGLIDMAKAHGLVLGELSWQVVDPLSSMVPDPPDEFQGDIKCMIGSAVVVAEEGQIYETRLSKELTDEQLAKMREVTRKKWREIGGGELSDEQCDEWIDREGPESAVAPDGTIH